MGDIQVHRKKKSNLTFLTMEEEHTISTLWEQDGCSEICSKEELWQAAKSDEMLIQLRGGDDASGALERQYEERFGGGNWMALPSTLLARNVISSSSREQGTADTRTRNEL